MLTRRRRRFGFLAAAMAPFALGATLGCQELPAIDGGECGNQIIDPGEDCDGKVPSDVEVQKGTKVVCGAPGSAHACRFDCTPPEEPGGEPHGCPATYACGADGTCRKPNGQFETVNALPASPSHVLLGDFDGDGLSDLLSLDDDSGQIDVYFFERDGAVARTFSLPSDGAVPAIGGLVVNDAGESARTKDFTLAVEGGLGVMQGQEDRTFVATAYSSVSVNWKDVQVVTARVIQDPGSLFVQEIFLALHNDPMKGGWGVYTFDLDGAGPPDPHFNLPPIDAPQGFALRLPVGNFIENANTSPCDEIVLMANGGTELRTITPCLGGAWATTLDAAQSPPLKLPNDVKVRGAIPAHLNPVHGSFPIANRDTKLDLVIDGEDGVYAAYGTGSGSFNSAPLDAPFVANQAVKLSLPEMPFAVADLNQDGAPDGVVRSGIFMSTNGTLPSFDKSFSQGYFLAAAPIDLQPWEEAVLVDFNGDGLLDVVATSPGGTGVQLFTNAGNGTFNPDLVATEQHVSNFAIGDFDGDLQKDIAFRQGPPDGPASVWVMFGQKGQAPLTPVSLGVLPGIDAMGAAGIRRNPQIPPDSISALGVLTHGDAGDSVAAFMGRADRLLQSPFLFYDNLSMPASFGTSLEAVAIGTFHAAADHGDTAVIVSDQTWCVPDPSDPTTHAADDRRRDARLWLLQGTGAAQVSQRANTGSLCKDHQSVVWQSAVMAPLDVDGDGLQELVIVAPNKGKSDADVGALFVARVDKATGGFDLGDMVPLPVRLYDRSRGLDSAGKGLRRNAPICVADVDGDSHPDVVMLSVDNQVFPPTTSIAVLWGTGNASAPFSGSAIGHVKLDAAESNESVTAVACTNADGDEATDLVVLTGKHAYLASGGKRELSATALLDARGQPMPGGVSVASDNIDDDGLFDLAISGPGGITIHRGKAIIP